VSDAVWVAAGLALGIAFFLIKSWINYLGLPKLAVSPGEVPLDLTVVIPARNEETNIVRAVGSFPGARVIVVDDDSTDRTAVAARAAGAEVIQAPALIRGALGKPNACLAGARASDSRWILFVDADTWYEPDFLPSLLTYVREEDLVAASVFLKQECRTLFERILMPYAFALYFCGVNSGRVNNPKARESLANGQCMLFRRDAYNYINGHKAALGSVIEDVALARVMKRHRMQARVLRAEHLGSVRMYDGLAAIWRGFQKNSFRFLLANKWSGIQVVVASILLTSYLPVLLWLASERERSTAIAFAAVPVVLLAPWYRSVWVIFAPVAIYLFQLVALNGMITTVLGRKAIWKGRRV
jgi:cellulose synthase/poly-beta-1,6-N-acetylglucosamine synthase-like glycosyltransferase